jgi:glycosyltransferase involved in cell wall biosynthesis
MNLMDPPTASAAGTSTPDLPEVAARVVWLVLHGSAELYGSDKVLLLTMAEMARDPVFMPVVVLNEDGPLRPALEAAGIEVHVGPVTKIRRAMFTPAGVFAIPRQLLDTARLLRRVTGGRRVGLVYSNTLAVLGGAIWAWRLRLPHLWHVHEILQRPAAVRMGLPWLAARLSRHVLANSHQTRAWLEQQAPSLRGRVTTVFNGLGRVPARDAVAAQNVRRMLGLNAGDVLATVAGRLNAWKGQDLLIEAVARLAARNGLGALHVAIVGDVVPGQEAIRDGLRAQVAAAGLAARVHFLPFIDDIWPVWHASDIAVVPSTEPEPFGMVAIEAMACGLPVVAAAHGGLLDIVEDGVTGLLFEPRNAQALAEALVRLTEGADERARLGAAGALRQARCFSLDAQVSGIRAAGLALMLQR